MLRCDRSTGELPVNWPKALRLVGPRKIARLICSPLINRKKQLLAFAVADLNRSPATLSR